MLNFINSIFFCLQKEKSEKKKDKKKRKAESSEDENDASNCKKLKTEEKQSNGKVDEKHTNGTEELELSPQEKEGAFSNFSISSKTVEKLKGKIQF